MPRSTEPTLGEQAHRIWVAILIGAPLIFMLTHHHWVPFVLPVYIFFVLIGLGIRAKDKRLLSAPSGSTRVETVKAYQVKMTVNEYAQAGWEIVDQSSAKSFGSQARVTMTFRKP